MYPDPAAAGPACNVCFGQWIMGNKWPIWQRPILLQLCLTSLGKTLPFWSLRSLMSKCTLLLLYYLNLFRNMTFVLLTSSRKVLRVRVRWMQKSILQTDCSPPAFYKTRGKASCRMLCTSFCLTASKSPQPKQAPMGTQQLAQYEKTLLCTHKLTVPCTRIGQIPTR